MEDFSNQKREVRLLHEGTLKIAEAAKTHVTENTVLLIQMHRDQLPQPVESFMLDTVTNVQDLAKAIISQSEHMLQMFDIHCDVVRENAELKQRIELLEQELIKGKR